MIRPNNLKKIPRRNRGFSLIELLVVISIISLLSSIIFAAVSKSKQKAEDARVAAEVHQVQTDLELYYEDSGGYPNPTNNGQPVTKCIGNTNCSVNGTAFSSKLDELSYDSPLTTPV